MPPRRQLFSLTQIALVITFLIFAVIFTPRLLKEPEPLNPQGFQAAVGQYNSLHAIYAEATWLDDNIHQVIIKYQLYDSLNSKWSDPIYLSHPSLYATDPYPLINYQAVHQDIITTTTCSKSWLEQKAVGWIAYTADNTLCGKPYYVLNDRPLWSAPTPLTNQSNIRFLQLQYSLDDVLYAAWIEYQNPENWYEGWTFYFWEVGSPNPPQRVMEGTMYLSSTPPNSPFKILPGRQSTLYVVLKSDYAILFRAYINGSWTEVESFSTIHSDWDAVLDSMERTHLVYTYEKNWDEVPTLRYASCFNGTWDVNTTLLAEAPTDGLWASVDESDDLQIVWLENSLTDFWGYYPYPYTMKCIAGHWTPKEQIVGLSEEWWYQGQLHMINAQQSHFLLEENVGLATQLVHYQLGPSYYSETHGTNVTGADRANILTTSYPQMIVYYQISAFGVTSVLMIGVLVFFPLLFRVLRASFRRIFTL